MNDKVIMGRVMKVYVDPRQRRWVDILFPNCEPLFGNLRFESNTYQEGDYVYLLKGEPSEECLRSATPEGATTGESEAGS